MSPLIKVPLRYGAIAGVLGLILLITLYYLIQHPFLVPIYMDFRIFLFGIFIFFTLKELRDWHFGGILYFWQGLVSAFLFTLVFATTASVGLLIFTGLEPEFLQSYISLTIEQLKQLPADVVEKIGKDVYDRNLQLLPATNAFDLVSLYFMQSLLISLFISIILSVILRRQPKT